MDEASSISQELNGLVGLLRQIEVSDDFRADGILQNSFMKLGAQRDVEEHNRPKIDCPLNKADLENLFASDAMCQRVCTLTPDEMKSGEVTLKGSSPEMEKAFAIWLRRSKFKELCRNATVLAQVYDRGAAIILDVQDGRPWDQPVSKGAVRGVVPLFVRDGYKVQPVPTALSEAEPIHYQFAFSFSEDEILNNLDLKAALDQIKGGKLDRIHRDRILWFPGIWCPPDIERRLNGSPSRLAIFWRKYSRYEMALALSVNLMARMSVINYGRKGLSKLLETATAESEAKLLREMQLVQNAFHNLGLIMSDMDNHKVEVITRNFAELSNLIDRFRQSAISASDLTEMDLFGMTLAGTGLSNDDMRDRMMRAARVYREQQNYWLSHFEKVAEYFLLGRKQNKGDWEIDFKSTLMLTPQEQLSLRGDEAMIDANYVAMGGLDPKVIYFKIKDKAEYSPHVKAFEAWQAEAETEAEAEEIFEDLE